VAIFSATLHLRKRQQNFGHKPTSTTNNQRDEKRSGARHPGYRTCRCGLRKRDGPPAVHLQRVVIRERCIWPFAAEVVSLECGGLAPLWPSIIRSITKRGQATALQGGVHKNTEVARNGSFSALSLPRLAHNLFLTSRGLLQAELCRS